MFQYLVLTDTGNLWTADKTDNFEYNLCDLYLTFGNHGLLY